MHCPACGHLVAATSEAPYEALRDGRTFRYVYLRRHKTAPVASRPRSPRTAPDARAGGKEHNCQVRQTQKGGSIINVAQAVAAWFKITVKMPDRFQIRVEGPNAEGVYSIASKMNTEEAARQASGQSRSRGPATGGKYSIKVKQGRQGTVNIGDQGTVNIGDQARTPEADQRGIKRFLGVTLLILIAIAAGLVEDEISPSFHAALQQVLHETILPSASQVPLISSVSPIYALQKQSFTISGKGFGSQVPFKGDLPCFEISDVTRGWAAGHIDSPGRQPYSGGACSISRNPSGDWVTVSINSWTDSRIDIDGFEGSYGQDGWYLSPGDELQIRVWNAQSGTGPSYFSLTVKG